MRKKKVSSGFLAAREMYKTHLVSRTKFDLLLGVVSTGRGVEKGDSALARLGEVDLALLDAPGDVLSGLVCLTVGRVVSGRDANKNGLLGGEGRTSDVDDLHSEAKAVLKASSVLVGALVGDGGEELVDL